MKTIRIQSPANIAFIKYWGQRDTQNILPYNDSFSMNLSGCFTTIEMKIDASDRKELYIKDYRGKEFVKTEGAALEKVIKFYETAKKYLEVKKDFGFEIYSENSFPKKAGIASSASFFSGLALAFATAFEKNISQKELSILARLSGSGSACRSIPDGFSCWHKGKDSSSSYAESIAPPDYWDVVDIVLVLNFDEKKVGSQEGHTSAATSPFFQYRLKDLEKRLKDINEAFQKKDFSKFGELIEDEAISMHSVMMTQKPPLYFWSGRTVEVIKKLIQLRKNGLEGYFTIDAGENIHIICQKKDESKCTAYFSTQPEVEDIIVNYPCVGARVL